ncbi:MAG: flavodoxin family protein [Pseudonocardia sp.]|jgi:multimeric flavodoxin WrbA
MTASDIRAPHAIALVCTLSPSPKPSSSELMARQVLDQLDGAHGVSGELVRVVDHDVKPGVLADMGDGDAWPALRERVLDADILVLATPTWVGHMSSVAQRVLERLDAELSETDDAGRTTPTGKCAIVAVVGNEDGAHKIIADSLQALNDVGFTVAANGSAYWNANIDNPSDYRDLEKTPDAVTAMIGKAAANTAHLARLLAGHGYPPAS